MKTLISMLFGDKYPNLRSLGGKLREAIPLENLIRSDLKSYLRGKGIEIGALHRPMNLKGTKVEKVFYVDRMSVEQLRAHYPELAELPLVTVDILDDGAILQTIPDGSLDFIIANHVIEHFENPLLALQTWYQKLSPGGVVFMAAPDKRYTFDKDRPLTSVEHLLEDFHASETDLKQRSQQHFWETAEIIEKRAGDDASTRVADLISRNYSIHHHVWTFESFKSLLEYLVIEMNIPYQIVDHSISFPLTEEFIFILGKDGVKKKNIWQKIKRRLQNLGNPG